VLNLRNSTSPTSLIRPLTLLTSTPRSRGKYFIAASLMILSLIMVKFRDHPFNYICNLSTEARRDGQFSRSCQLRHLALDYARAVGLGPSYIADIAFNLAYVYHNQGDLNRAREFCLLALRTEIGLKKHLETTALLAEIYDEQGRARESELLFEEIVNWHGAGIGEECPRNLSSDLNDLAGAYIRHGKYEKAREILLRLVEIDLNREDEISSSLHRDLSRLAYVDERCHSDVSTVASLWSATHRKLLMTEQEIAIAVSFADAHKYLNDSNGKGKLEEVYKPLWQLFDKAPATSKSLNFLRQQAYILNDEGRLKEAEYVLRNHYKRVLLHTPNDYGARADSLINLATSLRRQGRLAESVPIQAQAEMNYSKANEIR